MKMSIVNRIIITSFMLIFALNGFAQDFDGGIVKYQQTTKYDFAKLFGIDVKQGGRRADWVASMPSEVRKINRLVFTIDKAVYREDPEAQNEIPESLQQALSHLEFMAPPRVIEKQFFHDLIQCKVTRQIEFMTRNFLLEVPTEKPAWKLTQKMIKVQGYTCLAAEMQQGEDLVTAYFTSEVPVSVGPAEYGGLPGLILVVEINGETAYTATSIELQEPDEALLSKPGEGKIMTQTDFNIMVAEKEKEWQETRSQQRGTPRGHR